MERPFGHPEMSPLPPWKAFRSNSWTASSQISGSTQVPRSNIEESPETFVHVFKELGFHHVAQPTRATLKKEKRGGAPSNSRRGGGGSQKQKFSTWSQPRCLRKLYLDTAALLYVLQTGKRLVGHPCRVAFCCRCCKAWKFCGHGGVSMIKCCCCCCCPLRASSPISTGLLITSFQESSRTKNNDRAVWRLPMERSFRFQYQYDRLWKASAHLGSVTSALLKMQY